MIYSNFAIERGVSLPESSIQKQLSSTSALENVHTCLFQKDSEWARSSVNTQQIQIKNSPKKRHKKLCLVDAVTISPAENCFSYSQFLEYLSKALTSSLGTEIR